MPASLVQACRRALPTLTYLLLLMALAGCAAAEGASPDVRLRRLDNLAGAQERTRDFGELELLAAYHLDGPSSFGGLSAALLDREFLLLLSDRGHLFRARRVEDANGRLLDLRDWSELPLPAPARDADTEALARLPDGSLVVGAEGGRRLFRMTGDGRPATPVGLPDFLRDLPPNEGVEALATMPDGGLLAVSEGGFEGGPDSEVVVAGVLNGEEALKLGVRAPDGFRPTGADVAGDKLFLLERRVSLLGGLEARLLAVPLAGRSVVANRPLDGAELVRLGAGSFPENFEGVTARQAEDGRYLIYLVADDNFSALQRTILLQLAWGPESGKSEER